MKIEIGAGRKPTPGYVHVDAVQMDGVDVVDDGRLLSTFEADVADEIFAHWFLEHVARHEVAPMLKRWQRVLKPGGKIRLVTNNHEAHNRCLAEGQISWSEWSYLIYAVENKRGYNVLGRPQVRLEPGVARADAVELRARRRKGQRPVEVS